MLFRWMAVIMAVFLAAYTALLRVPRFKLDARADGGPRAAGETALP